MNFFGFYRIEFIKDWHKKKEKDSRWFDDHITVESLGTLPGTVRLNNMREIHFSRNPKMAQLLHEYEYVREFGEGVDCM